MARVLSLPKYVVSLHRQNLYTRSHTEGSDKVLRLIRRGKEEVTANLIMTPCALKSLCIKKRKITETNRSLLELELTTPPLHPVCVL